MEFREVEFLAQVDTFHARKDYQRGGRCIRFVAIHKKDEEALLSDSGVSTYIVDLSLWDFNRMVKSKELMELDDEAENQGLYYIKGVIGGKVNSGYFYETFSREEPTYFNLMECSLVHSSSVTQQLIYDDEAIINYDFYYEDSLNEATIDIESTVSWEFHTFHVGQGMCSLVTNGTVGVLLDAGAGKPIKRGGYQKNNYKFIHNELWCLIEGLSMLIVVISHPDHDHWRILSWDTRISDKLGLVVVPHNTKSIAWKDSAIKDKVVNISGAFNFITQSSVLECYRSVPSRITSNNECLVSLYVNRRGGVILQSGDYVYSEMMTDSNPTIRNLATKCYDAVVVPHHGDSASAFNIFNPVNILSKAFFSAGDHDGYGHPTKESINEHTVKGYDIICDNTLSYIKAVQLS